jgi:hypothetical protein
VGTPIVLGHDFDVLVMLAAIELVLDAEIREVDVVAEVRQVMFGGPTLDVARVAIGPAIAVDATAIGFL